MIGATLSVFGQRAAKLTERHRERAPGDAALFEPAALSRYAAALPRLATPYSTSGRSVSRSDFPPRDINASAGLLSTVVDLARYDAALEDHVFVSASTQAAPPRERMAGNQ